MKHIGYLHLMITTFVGRREQFHSKWSDDLTFNEIASLRSTVCLKILDMYCNAKEYYIIYFINTNMAVCDMAQSKNLYFYLKFEILRYHETGINMCIK